ncbi:hypothetical protein [Lacticaseibacillus saniviri]|uniref:hypothetical protein n=1 Tax=Lacticaseibacillus saniviri TaxID=931533 RepID=UPI0006D2C1CC|nr:hypothetical protein [Lacticaseibacillus saniviri]
MTDWDFKMQARAKEMTAQRRKLRYSRQTYDQLHAGELHTWTERDMVVDWLNQHRPDLIDWED